MPRISVQLLDTQNADMAVPAGGADGVDLDAIQNQLGTRPARGSLVINGGCSAGALSGLFRLWLWYPEAGNQGEWFPAGIGADATKGTVNGGNAIGETVPNGIRHAEPVTDITHATRAYLQLTAGAGTGRWYSAWVVAVF